ncbi:MAG: glutaredoxin domain-containing protein [Planctomycetota bacterium]
MRYSLSNKVVNSQLLSMRLVLFALILLLLCGNVRHSFAEQAKNAEEAHCAVLELFVRNDCADCPQVIKRIEAFANKRGRVKLYIHNLDEPGKHVDRFQQILQYFQLKDAEVPALYGCNTLLRKLKPDESTDEKLESLLTVAVYTRKGCAKCDAAKQFLTKLKRSYPVFEFKLHDLISDEEALDQVQALAQRYGKQAVSVPVFHFCNQLMVGWVSEESTGQKLEEVLKFWTTPCPKPKKEDDNQKTSSTKRGTNSLGGSHIQRRTAEPLEFQYVVFNAGSDSRNLIEPVMVSQIEQKVILTALADETTDDSLPPIPGGNSSAPLPPVDRPPPVDGEIQIPAATQDSDTIEVPYLGELSQSRLGMPAFTFLIGLVDGFNPCAMWVLLFLLSLLVNLRSRAKILAVAGTFVVISGLAYFAFMAAWLNVFLIVGYLPMVQLCLGIFAVVIGVIHVKDFFAFKKGISLSIPEWAKPGIYARARKIVTAENLTGAILGACVLAVLVNIIELLCTAGLPAMYTEILTMQNYPAWKSYAYLGLYIVAYMLDDTIMVTIVVVTLGRHKLQEREGRWLKLISGLIILLLGLVLIFKPTLLL